MSSNGPTSAPPKKVAHRHWAVADDEADASSYAQVPFEDEDPDDMQSVTALLSAATKRPGNSSFARKQQQLQACLTAKSFQGMVALLIIVNAVVIGLETDEPFGNAAFWELVENLLLLCFTVELALRLVAFGWWGFFEWSGSDFVWNVFDFSLVSLGVLDFFCGDIMGLNSHGSGIATIFRIFRLLRILRIFRLIRFLKQLYILTYGFALASLAIFWVSILMMAALYICAVVLVRSYGRLPVEDPDHQFFKDNYGDILSALFTLFQLMMQPNLVEYEPMLGNKPILGVFLVIFVIFGSFGMIALLTGVITEAMFEKNVLRLQEEHLEREASRKDLTNKCSSLFNQIKTDQDGEASKKEIVGLLPRVAELLEGMSVQFSQDDLLHMLTVMDTDGSGAINKTEFCRGLLHLAERSEEMQPILLMELQQDAITFVKNKVERLEASVARLERMHGEMLRSVQLLAGQKLDSQGSGVSGKLDGLSSSPRLHESENGSRAEDRGGVRSNLLRDTPVLEPASLRVLADAIGKVEQSVAALQGDMFSVGSRLEEIVSDARSEAINSQLGELAVRRRCMEFESATANRLSGSEAASRQAQRASEEAAAQVAALAAQVQALMRALEEQKPQ